MVNVILFILAWGFGLALFLAYIRLGILDAAIADLQREVLHDRVTAAFSRYQGEGKPEGNPVLLWHAGNGWDGEHDYGD